VQLRLPKLLEPIFKTDTPKTVGDLFSNSPSFSFIYFLTRAPPLLLSSAKQQTKPIQFAVAYTCRNNSTAPRNDLIGVIATEVVKLGPHKVGE
jgi:hypothetical protein